jgi:hypothetical protein
MIPTQTLLEIEDVREGTIIMKNKGLRGIILTSSLNFHLKSLEEREAILYQFQQFLNMLDFPIQILVQSRKLNITGYLEKLKILETKQKEELLKQQTANYRKFIEELVTQGNIYTKSFYIIVPYSLPEIELKSVQKLTEEMFRRSQYQLWERMNYVIMGLRKFGLEAEPLNTEAILHLLWSFYHHKESERGFWADIPPEFLK